MRITQTVMNNRLLRNYNINLTKMDKLLQQMETGSKINKPSDDPAGLVTALRMRTKLAQNEQFKKNVSDGKGWLESSDDALSNYTEILHRVRVLTVKGATGTNNDASLRAIADELTQLRDEIAQIANTTLDDRHLFGGSRTMKKAYDEATGQWLGNGNDVTFEISENIEMALNVDGRVFGLNDDLTMDALPGSYTFGRLNLGDGSGHLLTQTAPPTAASAVGLEDIDTTVDYSTLTGDIALNGVNIDLKNLKKLDATADINSVVAALQKDIDAEFNGVNHGGATFKLGLSGDKLTITSGLEGTAAVIDFTGTDTAAGSIGRALGIVDAGGNMLPAAAGLDAVLPGPGTLTLMVSVGAAVRQIELDLAAGTDADVVADLENKLRTALQQPPVEANGESGEELDPAHADAVTVAIEDGRLVIRDAASNGGSDSEVRFLGGTADSLLSSAQDVKKMGTQGSIFTVLQKIIDDLHNSNFERLGTLGLIELDLLMDVTLNARSELGAKTNRMEFVETRLMDLEVSYNKMLSDNEAVDYARLITDLQNQENVYRAALAAGARIIQPTLADYMR